MLKLSTFAFNQTVLPELVISHCQELRFFPPPLPSTSIFFPSSRASIKKKKKKIPRGFNLDGVREGACFRDGREESFGLWFSVRKRRRRP